jgi:glycosyltransferase involved in cell wall biosynthesis
VGVTGLKIERLAIVCFEDPRHVTGGVQRRVAAEVAYFAGRGVRVTVICEGRGKPATEDNVTYLPVATPNALYPLRALVFARRAARLLMSLPPFDLVETHHDSGAVGLLAREWMRRNGTTWVEVVHGVFADEFACVRRHSGLLSRETLAASGLLALSVVERASVRRADAVVAVSRYAAQQIERRYGVLVEQVHVLPNGIDTSIYSAAPEPRQQPKGQCEVVYVGRWHARKGVSQLVRALAVARAVAPDLSLTLIGNGPLEPSLRQEAASLGIAGCVSFKPGLSDEEVVAAYRTAGVVCVPSLQEGQGIVALEAQACGAPVVATRAGGLAEAVLEGETGMVVEPGDVDVLARALAVMSANSEMRRAYSARAAKWAAGFSWPDMLAGVYALYGDLRRNMGRSGAAGT